MLKDAETPNCNRTWWKCRLRNMLIRPCKWQLKIYTKISKYNNEYDNRNNNNNNNNNNKNNNDKINIKKNKSLEDSNENENEKPKWLIVQQTRPARRRNSQFDMQESSQSSNYNYNYNNSNNNKFNKANKLLITIILLLITTMTAAICHSVDADADADADADTKTTSTTTLAAMLTSLSMVTATPLHIATLAMLLKLKKLTPVTGTTFFAIAATTITSTTTTTTAVAAAAAAKLSAQQQQQQRQLFVMLTKNGQQTAAEAAAAAASGNTDDIIATSSMPHRTLENTAGHADNEDAAISLETIGFVSDDGDQRYEKAEKALAAAASASAAATTGNVDSLSVNRSTNNNKNNSNNNNGNCPKECTCLNDFFVCGKKHLDRVPTLPSYVQTLDLAVNKLNDTSVLQIRNLSELKRLSLKRNQLDVMPKFVGLTSLRQLNLANNRIQRISSEAISALPKLRLLDLTRNYLHTLEVNYFPMDNRLAHLILNANEIANIDENAFEHLNVLNDLELNNNRLANLPAGVFKNLNKLKKLSLSNNNLEINWSTFKGLESIQKLSLQSNNIRTLQDGVFHVMHKIESIELDHNSISSLSRQGLFNLTKLHNLSLSNNTISRIELDTWEFTQSLVSLDLSNNNISEFKQQHLDCLQQLRQLNLGHNKIQFFAENTFDCVKNLEDLNLKRNRLAWIIEDTGAPSPFKSLRKLKKLDLSGNNLKQINSKSLIGLSNLEQLNLEGNALASVQKGAFDHMMHLQKLKFKSMNFICDCEILWFRRWLQAKSHGSTQFQKNAICGYPDHLLDRELLTLTPAELICADSPKPVIVQEPSNQLAVKGANITMECIASSPAAASLAAADELKIKWRHDNQNLRERVGYAASSTPAGPTQLHNHHHNTHHHHHHALSNSYSTTETQIHHDQSTNQTTIMGYLRLYNVSYDSAGRYQCIVSNAFGTTFSQKFKLSIGIHPSFLQIPSNLTIDSGETARLVCSATGDPMPEIALQKFGASAFPAATERRLQVVREENAFIITNAKPIDTGIYTCTAESAAGEIKINASLIVNDKPQPSIPLVQKEVLLGSSSVLECLSDMTSELQQRPHREWFKDNKPFHTSTTSASERYYFTTEKELLVIVKTQSMDVGLYRCEITDNSKTYSLQTNLIVVEDINQNIIIIASAIVACILVALLVLGAVLCYQRRKMYLSAGHSLHSGSAARVIYDSSHRTLSGSRGTLDQTQLTTLNRSYLRPQYDQTMRPRSFADSEMNGNIAVGENQIDAEQRNCLIVSTTPSYRQQATTLQRQQRQRHQHQQHQHQQQQRNYDTSTDAYLRRNSLYDADHQQDHLSSKDSGTGSDAAVKRSIDDFTIALLPLSTSSDTHAHNELLPGTMPSDDDIDSYDIAGDASTPRAADSDIDIATSPVLGISEAIELREYKHNGNTNITSTTTSTPTTPNNTRYPHNSSNQLYAMHLAPSNSFGGGGGNEGGDSSGYGNHNNVGLPSPPVPNTKCKQDLSKSCFSANVTSLPATQVVDI